jgi:hypothetical protein
MSKDFKTLLKTCHTCEEKGSKPKRATMPLCQDIASHLLERIAMDVLGPLRRQKEGIYTV